MTDCCPTKPSNKAKLVKQACFQCASKSLSVDIKTILHHIKEPWNQKLVGQYYYCSNPNCDVVYFTEQNEFIYKADVRTSIGIKESSADALICFCFGVNNATATTDEHAKNFVIKQTKISSCSCETSNPSGRCCLKDFPKFN